MRFSTPLIYVAVCLSTLMFSIAPSWAMADNSLHADQTAARILTYFKVGEDHAPATNVTLEQFQSHLEELKRGQYNVMALPDIITAFKQNKALPAKTVALTFDGGDKSVLKTAMPLLKQYQFPFTVFLATDRLESGDPRYLNWNDITVMQKSRLINFGLHPETYKDISNYSSEKIRQKINNATSRLRDHGIDNIKLFSFPFGNNNKRYQGIIKQYGFSAALGQQSGVAHASADRFMLPRFVMTENYADLGRVQMTLGALPLTVHDAHPQTSNIGTLEPRIGFTVSDEIKEKLDHLSCFASGQSKLKTDILGKRVEIRLTQPIKNNDRFRVNCTLPVHTSQDETPRWRWLGFLMTPKIED